MKPQQVDRISTHGLQQVFTPKRSWTRKTKVFWLAVFLIFGTCSGLYAWNEYELYIAVPKTVRVYLPEGPLVFPAVTLCNINPFRLSMIQQYPVAAQLLAAAQAGPSVGRKRRSATTDTDTDVIQSSSGSKSNALQTRRKRQVVSPICSAWSAWVYSGPFGGPCDPYVRHRYPTVPCISTEEWYYFNDSTYTWPCNTITGSCVPGCYSIFPEFIINIFTFPAFYVSTCFAACAQKGYYTAGIASPWCYCGSGYVNVVPTPAPLSACMGPCAADTSTNYCGNSASNIIVYCLGCQIPTNVSTPYGSYVYTNSTQLVLDFVPQGFVIDGANATLVCNGPQYVLQPPNPPSVSCSNHVWSSWPPPGACLAPCNPFIPSDPNLQLNYSDPTYMRYNSTITAWCPANYTLFGALPNATHFVCTATSTWASINGANPSCQATPGSTTTSTSSTSSTSTTTPTTSTTTSTTTTTTTTPSAAGANGSCSLLLLTGGYATYYSSSARIVGSVLRWACNAGYFATGDAILTCGPNLMWQFVNQPATCSSMASMTLSNSLSNYSAAQLASMQGLGTTSDPLAQYSTSSDMLQYLLSPLSALELTQVGHQQQGMVVLCSYNGAPCLESDITQEIQDSLLSGNCYSFNHYPVYMQYLAGEERGLYIVLDTEQYDYLPTTLSTGMHLIIHDQFKDVFPSAQGILVEPGMMTTIAVRKIVEQRISSKGSPCINGIADLASSTPYYYAGAKYSTEACIRSSLQMATITACGCASPSFAMPSSGGAAYCDITEMSCVMNVSQTFMATFDAISTCPVPCTESDFDTTRSFSPLTPNMVNMLCPPDTQTPFCANVRASVAAIHVYFDTLLQISLVEQEAFQTVEFVSAAGGTMLILGGMSFISVLEFVFLFLKGVTLMLFAYERRRSQPEEMRDRLSSNASLIRVMKVHIKDAEAQASYANVFELGSL